MGNAVPSFAPLAYSWRGIARNQRRSKLQSYQDSYNKWPSRADEHPTATWRTEMMRPEPRWEQKINQGEAKGLPRLCKQNSYSVSWSGRVWITGLLPFGPFRFSSLSSYSFYWLLFKSIFQWLRDFRSNHVDFYGSYKSLSTECSAPKRLGKTLKPKLWKGNNSFQHFFISILQFGVNFLDLFFLASEIEYPAMFSLSM